MIHCLSVEMSATHGRRTCLACAAYLASSHLGSGTSQKSISRPISLKKRTRSRSCSAIDSFCTSLK